MSYILYLAVLIVSISSVVFGVDWLAKAPLPAKPAIHTADVQPAIPPQKKAAAPDTADAKTAEVNTLPDTTGAGAADTASTVAEDKPAMTAAQPKSASTAPACNVQACEAAYHTFRASDCTYQPYDGPRRFCDKGQQETVTRTAAADVPAQAQAASCNIRACERAYQSFDPSDCTYQPYNGPRRLCER